VLRTYLWRLRRALVPVGDVALVRKAPGYKLMVDEQWVDLHRFRRLLGQAGTAGGGERAVALLEEALGLWRGEAFGALDTPWLARMRRVVEAERLATQRDLTDLQLGLGRHGVVLARASSWAGEHPLDERLAGQVMVALFRCGRQADALREYQRMRTLLADELGADPGHALQELYQRILTNDSLLALAPAYSSAPKQVQKPGQAEPSAATNMPVPRQLPPAVRWLTGRHDEVDAVLGPLRRGGKSDGPDAVSVVAIDGMAGVGKTAFAVLVAHRLAEAFPGGQLFMDLHGHTEGRPPRTPGEALECFLQALGVPPGQIPGDTEARAALYRHRLSGTRMLIVLDNAAGEGQIRPLLPGGGGCLAVVTSRRRLKGLDEAHCVSLGVLPPPDAVALLRAVIGDCLVAAEERVLAEIAQLCGHLPLALRIAATLVRHRPAWSLANLAEQLRDRRVGALADGERDLGAVFDLSYRSLPDSHRLLFRRLGLVPDLEADAYAAAALSDTAPGRAAHMLEELVDHNLLICDAPGRYRMHDLVRLHARDLAGRDPAPMREAAVIRLLDYYQHTAGRTADLATLFPGRRPAGSAPAHAPDLPDADAAWAWLHAERTNLLAALDYTPSRYAGAPSP
jgi:DNA-binding SARP family transcriptional activator